MNIYSWKDGANRRVDARLVGEFVEKHGGKKVCPPEKLVDEARPEDSEMHPMFEWDNDKCGEIHRKEQARQIIRNIEVVRSDHPDDVPTLAFVSVTVIDDDGVSRGYVPVERLVTEPELQRQAEQDVLSQLQGLRRRHERLHALSPVWKAIDEVSETLEPDKV